MKKAKILVVEDEAVVAHQLKVQLQKMGHDVPDTAATGEDAISIFKKTSPDLVLMDIVLFGEMDGIETARQIHLIGNTPIIYITAYTDAVLLDRAKETGPFGYLSKPFSDHDLRNTIEMALYKYKAENELKKSEQKYHSLVENIPDVTWTTDINGNTTFVSSNVGDIYGYTPEEICNAGPELWFGRIHPDDKEEVKAAFHDLFEKSQPLNVEYRIKRKDNRWIWLRDRSTGSYEKDGLKFADGVFFDITMHKKTAIELKEAFDEINKLKEQLEAENLFLREEVKLQHEHGEILGQSDAIKGTLKLVEQVAGTGSTVLILGETGTGKELLAQAIHDLSKRKDRPMVKVNCAAIPSNLIESELFGREKGAYTGAVTTQVGRFEVANGSTLFLDEIGELAPELQVKFLRVLQDGSLERLGSTKTIKVDVRVIAATNRDIEQAVKDGEFRSDLYYRLNVFPIPVPPLRERHEDILILVWSFVREFEKDMGKQIESIPKKDIRALQSYSWPGNVREIKNLIERSMIMASGSILHIEMPQMSEPGISRSGTLDEVEKEYILSVLKKTRWRVRGESGAAEILGLKPTTLDAKMKKLQIKR